MNRKTVLVITSIVLLIASLTACGGDAGIGAKTVPNEERTQNDIAASKISPIQNNRTVDSIDLVNEETDTDATSVLPHEALDVSDNDLIAVLSRSDIPFSASTLTEYDKLVNQATVDIAGALLGIPFLSLLAGTDPTEQTFSFTPEDVTDFVVLYSTVEENGTVQTFYSYFVLHKELATIGINAKVTYRFDSVNGWVVEDTAFISKIESVANLAGTRWFGTATETPLSQIVPQFILYITEFNEDGTMKATFDFPSEPHSGTLTGFYDSNRLSFSFSFDEWIDLPYWGGKPVRIGSGFERGYQINLDGYLFIEDAILRSQDRVGTTSKNGFNVTFGSWFDVSAPDNDS